MRALSVAAVLLSAGLAAPVFGGSSADRNHAFEVFDALPLRFERIGDGYLARARDYDLRLSAKGAVIARGTNRIELRFDGAASHARMRAEDELPGRTNYLVGSDSSRWIRNVRGYGKVRYSRLYRGIDALFYGSAHEVEVDLIVGPDADPQRIGIDVNGAEGIETDGEGNVHMRAGGDDIVLEKPRVFQLVNGKERPVRSAYRIEKNRTIRFDVAKYDRSKQLVIDPVVVTGTVIGTNAATTATVVTRDSLNAAYVGGQTASTALATLGSLQPTIGGGNDAFVEKIDSSGNVVFATYIGGSGNDIVNGIAVDSGNNVYAGGSTTSTNFPVVSPMQATLGGSVSGFLAKLNSSGSALVYSTYFGTSSSINAVAVDSAGDAFIAGDVSGSIPTVNAIHGYSGQGDAFAAKINPAGSAAIYATYLGGGDLDSASGIAVSSTGNAWVAGSTYSPNFDTLNALQPVGGVTVRRSTDGGLTWAAADQGLTRGATASIAFDPTNALNVYRSDFRGAYKSTDGGLHWTQILDPASNFILPIVVDPTNPLNVYFGDTIGGGVRKSTDGGATTNGMSTGLTNTNVYALAIDSTNPLHLYAGTSNGLFQSVTGAAAWSATGLTSGFVHTIAIDPTNPLNVYVGTDRNGVQKSTNGGTTFSSASTGIPFTPINWLAVNPANAADLWAATGSGVYHSTNSGGSWTNVTAGLSATNAGFIAFWLKTSPTLVTGGPAGMFESANGGAAWNRLTPGGNLSAFAFAPTAPNTALVGGSRTSAFFTELSPTGTLLTSSFFGGSGNDSMADIALDSSDDPTFAGTTGSIDFPTTSSAFQKTFGGGLTDAFLSQVNPAGSALLFSTFFGGSGDDRGTGLGVGPYLALVGDTPSTNLPLMRPVAGFGGAQPWFKSFDGGATWSGRPIPGPSVAVSPLLDSTMFSASGPVMKSIDGGATWSVAGTGSPSVPGVVSVVADYVLTPAGSNVIAVAGPTGIYVSVDDGATWSLAHPADVFSAATAIAGRTMSNGKGVFYVATNGGMLKSQDSGATWTFLSSISTTAYDDVFIDPTNSNTVYVSNSNGVYKSTDGGNTWAPAGTITGGKAPYHIAVDPNAPLNVYVGSKGGGAYKSTDGGSTFNAVNNNGLTSLVINSIVVAGSPSSVLVGADDGVVESSNGGATWTRLGLANLNVKTIDVDPVAPSILLARAQGHSSLFTALFQPPSSGGQLTESTYFPGSGDIFSAGKAIELPSGKLLLAAQSSADDDPATGTRQQWTSPPPPPSGSGGTVSGAVTAALGRMFGFDLSALACSADLAITGRTMTPNPVPVGGSFTMTYTVTNKGPDVDSVVVFDYALPTSFAPTILTMSSTRGTCNPSTATCTIGSMAPGDTVTITMGGKVPNSAPPFNLMEDIAFVGGDCRDAAPDNNGLGTSYVVGSATGGVHGDANGDGKVTVADIFYLINYLFVNGAAPVGTADVNGDGIVNAADIFYLINYLFAGGAAPK